MDSNNEFDLLGNARESLEHAVDHLTRVTPPSTKDLKRAILDVTHVVELVLKESLQRIHPVLIWEKVDDFPDEEKRTINTELAVQRLIKIGGVKFSDRTIENIKAARKIRNKIEHFKFSIDEKGTHVVIGRLLSLIFDFSKRKLLLNWEEEFREDVKWRVLIQDIDFWRAHAPVIEKRMIEEEKNVFECQSCNAETFNLDSEECELCGHKEEVGKCDNCKKRYPESFLNDFSDEDSGSVIICDNCCGPDEDYYSD